MIVRTFTAFTSAVATFTFVLGCVTLSLSPLAAQAASPCRHPETRQFDFWIGEWNIVNRGLTAEGWAETGRATAKVFPVLDGCAIVEQWRGTAWNRKTIGFSVRNFDPKTGKWFLLLNWPGSGAPGFGVLEGRFTHGRGEFFSESTNSTGETVKTRYTFSDATPDSLRWDGARSSDDGASWSTFWIMEFTRRNPATELPLWNGPWLADGRARHCGQPEVAQLDFLAGGWEGVETRPSSSSEAPTGASEAHSVRLQVVPILEGCAYLEHAEVLGPLPYEQFAVRAWEPSEKRWVQYEMDTRNQRLSFLRRSGVASEAGIELLATGSHPAAGRLTWRLGADGTLTREELLRPVEGVEPTRSRWALTPTTYGVFSNRGQGEAEKSEEASSNDG